MDHNIGLTPRDFSYLSLLLPEDRHGDFGSIRLLLDQIPSVSHLWTGESIGACPRVVDD